MYWKWRDGRQDSGYKILTIYWFYLPYFETDCHLIYYPTGSRLPVHRDKFYNLGQEMNHYRLNILLKKPKTGGKFFCRKTIINWWRVSLFKASKWTHGVTKVENGERLVLTFGFAFRKLK